MQAEIPADAAKNEKSAPDPMKAPLDGPTVMVSREWLVEVDSTTSWVAHRVARRVLGEDNERRLLAISAEARRLAALPAPPGDLVGADELRAALRGLVQPCDMHSLTVPLDARRLANLASTRPDAALDTESGVTDDR